MATSIQLLRSNIAQLRPDPATLAEGMPMVNLNETEPGLFFRLRDGSLAKIGPVSVGVLAPNSSAQGFAGNSIGEQWVDTSGTSPTLKIWDGTAWVETGGGSGTGQKGDKGDAGTNGTLGSKGDKGQKGGQAQILNYIGVVNTPADRPAGANAGDAVLVLSSGTYSAWNGVAWEDVGSISKGEKGLTGAAGQKGADGSAVKGAKGETGDKGATGAGTKGDQGVKGEKGEASDKGEKGEAGAKGEKGVGQKGATGAAGTAGAASPALYFRGNVANAGLLPGGASSGDVYYVIAQATYYAWDTSSSTWYNIGQIAKGESIKGDAGDKGVAGDAATISVGTTTTVDSSSSASVANSGTSSVAVLDFTIPKGEKGPKGLKGDKGLKGEKGTKGQEGEKGSRKVKKARKVKKERKDRKV